MVMGGDDGRAGDVRQRRPRWEKAAGTWTGGVWKGGEQLDVRRTLGHVEIGGMSLDGRWSAAWMAGGAMADDTGGGVWEKDTCDFF
jgi:hypothetical protein